MSAILKIINGKKIYMPALHEGITWDTERKSVPGILKFSVVYDPKLKVTEGNIVSFKNNDDKVFLGFIFQKKESKDKSKIDIIAYDQLRYFKNKETYIYTKKTTSWLIKKIASDFKLNIGKIADTKYAMSRVEDNKTLFDTFNNSNDETLRVKKKIYVLYDDFGKLVLKSIEDMYVNILIDEASAEDYDYTSSIDGETYNKIKLFYKNEKTGKRDIYIAQDSKNMNKWGTLQMFESINDPTIGKAKANALLELYNQKTRNLSIKKAFGDIRVRAGSSVIVSLQLNDMTILMRMVVEKAKHTFNNGIHTMDLNLRGGEFIV